MKTNIRMLTLASCVALCAASSAAYAFDIHQINGMDTNRAARLLQSEGYTQVGTKRDNDKLWVLWFNRDNRECAGFVEKNGEARKERTFDNHVCRDNRESSYGGHDHHGDNSDGNVPGWMVGYFRGHNRGSDVSLNISRDGSVVATIDGKPVYGEYRDGKLRIGLYKFYIDRDDDGLTTRQSGNESNVVHYRRR